MNKKIKNILKNKKTGIILLLGFSCFFLDFYNLHVISEVHAAGFGMDDIRSWISGVSAFLMNVVNVFVWIALALIGSFMDNDYIFGVGKYTNAAGKTVGVEGLREIWIIVRDFVNVAFVFVLIGAAIATVVTAGINDKGNNILKKILPRMVIALILVNFSYLACKVVLDTSNLMTTAVFSIAKQDSLSQYFNDFLEKNCENIKTEEGKCHASCTKPTGFHLNLGNIKKDTKDIKSVMTMDCSTEPISASDFDYNSAAMMMALGIQRIIDLPRLAEATKDTSTLAIGTVFAFILFAVYAAAYIALLVALIIRIIMLWVMIPFSPIAFLLFSVGDQIGFGGAGEAQKKFFHYAFLPVKVAVVMTASFIMVAVNYTLGSVRSKWLDADLNDTINVSTSMGSNGDFRNILWGIATAMVMFIGVKWAMSGGYESKYTDKIMGFAGSMGKFLADKIKYAPIIPMITPKGNVVAGSMGTVGSLSTFAQKHASMLQAKEQTDLWPQLMPTLYGDKEVQEVDTEIKKAISGDNYPENLSALSKAFALGNRDERKFKLLDAGALITALDNLGASKEASKNLRDAIKAGDMQRIKTQFNLYMGTSEGTRMANRIGGTKDFDALVAMSPSKNGSDDTKGKKGALEIGEETTTKDGIAEPNLPTTYGDYKPDKIYDLKTVKIGKTNAKRVNVVQGYGKGEWAISEKEQDEFVSGLVKAINNGDYEGASEKIFSDLNRMISEKDGLVTNKKSRNDLLKKLETSTNDITVAGKKYKLRKYLEKQYDGKIGEYKVPEPEKKKDEDKKK